MCMFNLCYSSSFFLVLLLFSACEARVRFVPFFESFALGWRFSFRRGENSIHHYLFYFFLTLSSLKLVVLYTSFVQI